MLPLWIPAAIAAGGALLGGAMDRSARNKQNKRQMDFAKNFLQYRTADAKKAGIHPMAALGAPTVSPSVSAGDPMGNAVADASKIMSKYAQRKQEREAQQEVFAQQKKESEARIRESMARSNLANAKAFQLTTENEPISLVPEPTNDKIEVIGMDAKGNPKVRRYMTSSGEIREFRGAKLQDLEDELGEIANLYGLEQARRAEVELNKRRRARGDSLYERGKRAYLKWKKKLIDKYRRD